MFSFGSSKPLAQRWNTDELKELEAEFDATVKLFDSILPAMKTMHQNQQNTIKKLTEFSEAMSSHGQQEKYPLSKVFEKCAIAHKGLADVQTVFINRYKAIVIDPVNKFIDKDIKDAKQKRKDFRNEVSKVDTKKEAVAKLEKAAEKADKLRAAQAELQTQEVKCDGLRDDLVATYRSLLHKKRLELTTLMRELGMMQLESFDSCQRVVDQPHREIEEISVDVFSPQRPADARSSLSPAAKGSAKGVGADDNPFLDEVHTPRGDDE